jgi:hypothetical protein
MAEAYTYSQHKQVASQAPVIAKQFLERAQSNDGSARFYSQTQIDAAMKMVGAFQAVPESSPDK